MPGEFLDTNVLVYLAQNNPEKTDRVEQLLASQPVVSVQVLNELANVLRRKASFDWRETNEFLAIVRSLARVEPLTLDTHELGLSVAERYGLSIYDALIAAVALRAECGVLWSEDMQDGLRIDDQLRVQNPFG